MCGWALSSRPAPAAALDHPGEAGRRERRPALADEDKGRIYLPSVERLAHLIAKRNPPDSIGAEPNLLSQTQTHAVRLGTSAASELIPRLSKHRLIRLAPTLAELGLDGMKLIKKMLFLNKFRCNHEPVGKSQQSGQGCSKT
jgi:hypothetical protein